MSSYATPPGGLPPQTHLLTGRAIFTEAYVVIPKTVMTDIVTSNLPGWADTRAWVLARPLSGFAETFAQLVLELRPGGGSAKGEPDPAGEGVIFVTKGEVTLSFGGADHKMGEGGYAYLPAGLDWALLNRGRDVANVVWIRKAYESVPGIAPPAPFVTNERALEPVPMPGTNGDWSTTRFVDPDNLAHDMHVNIVNFNPGGVIPFAETHVMEHGLYVLEGKAVYRLNADWVEVEAGDFMWLRAFCPQACYAGGPGRFRYLLYKDVNRHPRLGAF